MRIDKYNEVGIPTLERATRNKAKPADDCAYPLCEECDKYHGHYCTVPIVVSKQHWRILEEKLWKLYKRVDDLENIVTDEILGSDKDVAIPAEAKLNYTWADYFEEEDQNEILDV